jgi:sRNA-binding protein
VGTGSNGAEIRQIYDQIEKEHQKLGRASNVSFDQLRSMIEKQSESVRERYKVNAVAFRVDVVDGKVKLKAKPVQEK